MMRNDPKPPRRPVDPRASSARIWATGYLLGNQLVLAHRMDDVIAAAFAAEYDPAAPAGEQRRVRSELAARTAEWRQGKLNAMWAAGIGGREKWVLREQSHKVEVTILAAKDRALERIPEPWPEEGPALVLVRDLYSEHDVEAAEEGSREWIDPRTPMTLVRSLAAAGMLTMGRL